MAMERYQGSEALSAPASPDQTLGLRASIAGIGDLIGVAGRGEQMASQAVDRQAQVSGRLAGMKDAVQRDAQGNLLPLSTLPEGDSIYGASYRDAAIQTYGNSAAIDAQIHAHELRQKFLDDPAGYLGAWNEYQKTSLAGLHGDVAPQMAPIYTRIGGEQYGQIADEHALRVRQAAVDGDNVRIQQLVRDGNSTAYNLGVTPASLARVSEMAAEVKPLLLDIQRHNPDFNDAKLNEQVRVITSQFAGQALMGQAWQEAIGHQTQDPTTGIKRPDTGRAKAWLDEQIASGGPLTKLMNADELKAFVQQAHGWVAMRDSEQDLHRAQVADAQAGANAAVVTDWQIGLQDAASQGDAHTAAAAVADQYRKLQTLPISGGSGERGRILGQLRVAGHSTQLETAIAAEKNDFTLTMLSKQREHDAVVTQIKELQGTGQVDKANELARTQLTKILAPDYMGPVPPRERVIAMNFVNEEARAAGEQHTTVQEQQYGIQQQLAVLKGLGSFNTVIQQAQVFAAQKDYGAAFSTLTNGVKQAAAGIESTVTDPVAKQRTLNLLQSQAAETQQSVIASWQKDYPILEQIHRSNTQGVPLAPNATGAAAANYLGMMRLSAGGSVDITQPEGATWINDTLRKQSWLPDTTRDDLTQAISGSGNPYKAALYAQAFGRAAQYNPAAWINVDPQQRKFLETMYGQLPTAPTGEISPEQAQAAMKATLGVLGQSTGDVAFDNNVKTASRIVADDAAWQKVMNTGIEDIATSAGWVDQLYRAATGQERPITSSILRPQDKQLGFWKILMGNDATPTDFPPELQAEMKHMFINNFGKYGAPEVAMRQTIRDIAQTWGLSGVAAGAGAYGALEGDPLRNVMGPIVGADPRKTVFTRFSPEAFTGMTTDQIKVSMLAHAVDWYRGEVAAGRTPAGTITGEPYFATQIDEGKAFLVPDTRAFANGRIGWVMHFQDATGADQAITMPGSTFIPMNGDLTQGEKQNLAAAHGFVRQWPQWTKGIGSDATYIWRNTRDWVGRLPGQVPQGLRNQMIPEPDVQNNQRSNNAGTVVP